MNIDTDKIMAMTATQITKDLVKSIFTYIPSKISSKYDVYFKNFEDYIERTSKICSKIKTIIKKDASVNLRDIYVKSKYKCSGELIDDDELIQRVRDGERVVVCGFGGIGKTIFCKYLWCSVIENPKGKIPVFFELRNLNDISQQNLEAYVRLSLISDGKSIPDEIFKEMMLAGRFIFIFDGFDEVPEKNRMEIQTQLLRMANLYADCCFVISSRMDERFGSWVEFKTYNTQEFEKSQSREVIQKTEFDKETKKEFLSEILEKRYKDYQSFFSTPLLTLMMLMTYMQIKYVPESRHIFYRYAFQTLYTLHDASKQGFQRVRFVEMSETDFIHVFSLFCLVSYIDREHIFNKETILKYFENVKDRTRINYEPEKFLKESVDSVNLIYRDGDQYSFVHRSFQEYFCAYAATHFFPDKVLEVIQQIPIRHSDSVYSMMYSINADVVTRMYIIPSYKNMHGTFNDYIRDSNEHSLLRKYNFKFELIYDPATNSTRFGYGFEFSSDVKRFSDSVLAIFKSEMPFIKQSERLFYGSITELLKKLRILTKKIRKNRVKDVYYRAVIEFSTEEVFLKIFEPSSPDIIHKINFEDSSLSGLRFFEKINQGLKAELVFCKKKCDEISRNNKEISRKGAGVLSL